MAKPAIRSVDQHACPAHGPGGLGPAGSSNVLTNGQLQVRTGDPVPCAAGAPNVIATGASTVTVNSEFAARAMEKTRHLGVLLIGSRNVVIGGPSATGCIGKGKETCAAAAAGRRPPPGAVFPPEDPRAGQPIPAGTPGQSYSNCGIESCRQIINRATGRNIGQEEILDDAMEKGYAQKDPASRFKSGASTADDRAKLLSDYGVPAETVRNDLDTIKQRVLEGKGVISDVYYGSIQTSSMAPGTGAHSVWVTGVEFDEAGNVTALFINDTGRGTCSQRIPAARFDAGLMAHSKAVATKNPVW